MELPKGEKKESVMQAQENKPRMFTLVLSEPELAQVLSLVKQAPMFQVEGIVRNIERQAVPQLSPAKAKEK